MAVLCLLEATRKCYVKDKPRTSVVFMLLSDPFFKAREILSRHRSFRVPGFLHGEVSEQGSDDIPYGQQAHFFFHDKTARTRQQSVSGKQ